MGGGIRLYCVLLALLAAGTGSAGAQTAQRGAAGASSSPAVPPFSLAALAIRDSTASDGSSLSLVAFKDGLIRDVVFPDGTSDRTIFRLLNGRLGTVSEGNGNVVGMFALDQGSLSTIYADGRSETLVLDAARTIRVMAKAANGALVCAAWYPAAHRFSASERGTGCAAERSVPGSAVAPVREGTPAAWQAFDRFYSSFVAAHEGGYVENDGNGSPANYGINQGANPDVQVASLTQGDAEQILYQRYWLASGADQLPPALAAVQGDTAINMGVKAADDLLARSGGDPQTYLQLRDDKYRAIAAASPDKAAYLPLWLERNDDLRGLIGDGDDGGRDEYATWRGERSLPAFADADPDY